MQYPGVTGANVVAAKQGGKYGHGNGNNGDSRGQGGNGLASPGNEAPIFRHAQTTAVLKGIVSTTPRTGLFVNGFPGLDLENNVLMGHE
eukprot:COSAG04_NODE_29512_length_268_cov_0.917160_1_plen_88_part_11